MRHARLLECAIAVTISLAACTPELHAEAPEPLKGRIIQSLNGPWKHKADTAGQGENAGWQRAIPSDAEEAALPAAWRMRGNAIDWYWREVRLPKLWQTANVRLQLPPATGVFDLFVNGKKAVADANGLLVDITKQIDATAANVIAIRLEAKPPAPPAARDLDEIDLLISDEAYIESAEVITELGGWIKARVNMRNASDKTGDADLVLDLYRGKRKFATTQQSIVISPGRNRAELSIRIKPSRSPDESRDCIAMIELRQKRDLLDNVRLPFELAAGAGR